MERETNVNSRFTFSADELAKRLTNSFEADFTTLLSDAFKAQAAKLAYATASEMARNMRSQLNMQYNHVGGHWEVTLIVDGIREEFK